MLTGLVAFVVGNTPAIYVPIFQSPEVGGDAGAAGLRAVLLVPHPCHLGGHGAGSVLGVCAVMGLSLSSIFLVFTGASIANTFFIAAAMFGATSLYGYTPSAT